MLDMTLINNTIRELEQGETNFATCERLASLYIIREHNQPKEEVSEDSPKIAVDTTDSVRKELSDIIPHYDMYCVLKRQYQLHMVDTVPVIQAFRDVTREIHEFINTLYSSTDMEEERNLLVEMLDSFSF